MLIEFSHQLRFSSLKKATEAAFYFETSKSKNKQRSGYTLRALAVIQRMPILQQLHLGQS
jgi:hypothetical protein